MSTSFDDLEAVYEALAVAIDRAGPEAAQVYLAKVVLLLAARLDDRDATLSMLQQALDDL